jgi:hypothetical protein
MVFAIALVMVLSLVLGAHLYASVQALVRVFVWNGVRMLKVQHVTLLGVEIVIRCLR